MMMTPETRIDRFASLQEGQRIHELMGISTPSDAVVLISSAHIQSIVQQLAQRIGSWIQENLSTPTAIVALLEGGRFYTDRLIQALHDIGVTNFTRLDIKVSTRDGDGRPLLQPSITGDIDKVHQQRTLIVDDILDSGLTLQLVHRALHGRVRELKTTVLIQKDNPSATAQEIAHKGHADFVGYSCKDTRWFSGAGMDMPGDPHGVVRSAPIVIAYPPVY